jgi:MoxR-like ATPase
MVTIKKYPMGTTHYWKVSPGERALEWEKCRDGGSIGLAWNEVGDMSSMTRKEFEARRDEVLKRFPDWTATGMEQLWKFARIPEGDKIVANRGTTEVMGIGTVVGPYFFQPDANYAHRLPVEWDDVRPRAIVREAWRKTLIPLSREEFEEICRAPIKELEITYTPPEPPPSTKQPVYSLQEISKDTGFDIAMLERWVRALNRKRQAIIYGPPGTGKTYIAERLAKHLIGGSDGFFDLVQFHPAYAYEDFIQGIRPQVRTNGDLDYQMVPGRFLDFCSKATRAEGTCVLIIDEINRAKLSHVFGELMYLLEYRDQEVPLAGGGLLRIPRNVRIIGTMNTADRSIALADHALRRRFASFHLAPNYEVLRRYHEEAGFPSAGLVNVLTKLNKQIADAHYEIGISFFLRRDIAQQVEDIWKMEIEPYLEEYFFDQPDKVSEFRWEKVGDQIMNPQ